MVFAEKMLQSYKRKFCKRIEDEGLRLRSMQAANIKRCERYQDMALGQIQSAELVLREDSQVDLAQIELSVANLNRLDFDCAQTLSYTMPDSDFTLHIKKWLRPTTGKYPGFWPIKHSGTLKSAIVCGAHNWASAVALPDDQIVYVNRGAKVFLLTEDLVHEPLSKLTEGYLEVRLTSDFGVALLYGEWQQTISLLDSKFEVLGRHSMRCMAWFPTQDGFELVQKGSPHMYHCVNREGVDGHKNELPVMTQNVHWHVFIGSLQHRALLHRHNSSTETRILCWLRTDKTEFRQHLVKFVCAWAFFVDLSTIMLISETHLMTFDIATGGQTPAVDLPFRLAAPATKHDSQSDCVFQRVNSIGVCHGGELFNFSFT